MTHEILDHPADVKFRVTAPTLEAAFAEVVAATSDLVGGVNDTQSSTVTREVDLEARTLEALLFDFLDKLILLQDLEDAVVTHADALDIDETESGIACRRCCTRVRSSPISLGSISKPRPTVRCRSSRTAAGPSKPSWTSETGLE